MDPFTSMLIGGTAGGFLQGLGGFMSGSSQQKAAKQMRKLLETFMNKTADKADLAQKTEKAWSAEQLFRATREMEKLQQSSQSAGIARLFQTLGSPAYREQAGYIQDMFAKGVPDSIAAEYAGRIRSAQAARGIEGNMAAVDEAALLTKMAEQGRQALLPQLRQLAMDPFELKQQAVQTEIANRQAAQSVGLAQFQAALQGRQGAAQVAYQDVLPLANLFGSLTSQMPVSAANPWANAFGALGTMASGIGNLYGLQGMMGGK